MRRSLCASAAPAAVHVPRPAQQADSGSAPDTGYELVTTLEPPSRAVMGDSGATGGHPKMSFAAAARAVATVSNKEKFERLKASRDKAKEKLALARVEIARCVGGSWLRFACCAGCA